MVWRDVVPWRAARRGARRLSVRPHRAHQWAVARRSPRRQPRSDCSSAASPISSIRIIGRVSDVPWAIGSSWRRRPAAPPSLEALLEGLVLFIILRIATHRFHALTRPGTVFGLFLVFYGIFRSMVEFVREPHAGHSTMISEHVRPWHRLFHSHDPARRLAGLAGAATPLGRVMSAQRKPLAKNSTPLADLQADCQRRADQRARLYGRLPYRSARGLLHDAPAARRRRRFHHRAGDQPDVRRADRHLGGHDVAGDG